MPTEVATLCFHTKDAVERREGSFRFDVPCKQLRNHAMKVALASCEFPMVQQTIEAGWNCIYYMESLRLTAETNWLEVKVEEVTHRLSLPPRQNEASIRCDGKRAVITTESPHHLFGPSARPLSVFARLIVASSLGDVELDDIEYVNENTFVVTSDMLEVDRTGVVFCAAITSPVAIATLLTECSSSLPLSFQYDDKEDRIVPTTKRGGTVQFLPSPLASLCGFSLTPCTAKILPSQSGQWFEYTQIPTGFYGPCHRPMCVGQPLPLGPVVEMSLNRYYFPLLGGNGNGPTSHLFVFTSPDGVIHSCTILPGRYDKKGLASYLEREMTLAVVDSDVRYRVSVTDDDRWSFSCERKNRNQWREAIFSIMFHHPMSIEPQRLGFSSQPMSGCSSYVSSRVLQSVDRPLNLIRMSEDVPRKRFRLHAAGIPTMIGVVSDCGSSLVFRTYVNKKRYSHGLRAGDVVKITSFSGSETEDGACSETPHLLHGVHSCIVQDVPDASLLSLRVPSSVASSLSKLNSSVQILSEVEPWCVHFGKPRSVPAHMVGWPKGGIIWARDGSNNGLPPYEAPYVHNLDHPDYVCMTFSETGSMNMEHTFGGVTQPIFCKLSLYPLFREERMLPRDTQLMHSNMASFTISFWNPDMITPYMFHGAEFSFSLALFSAVPDA